MAQLLSASEYVARREAYSYRDALCCFEVGQTGNLVHAGEVHGIYPGTVPSACTQGANLRKFEAICQEVFHDCSACLRERPLTEQHVANISSIACAIVHWKMASQGGRARVCVQNVRKRWTDRTALDLIGAYRREDMAAFRIPGVGIPTATAFMRFLFPDRYGIMDRRLAQLSQARGLTGLSLRHDGYVTKTSRNVDEYTKRYIPLLRAEADRLNAADARFRDVSSSGAAAVSRFRPCDVEMALWQEEQP